MGGCLATTAKGDVPMTDINESKKANQQTSPKDGGNAQTGRNKAASSEIPRTTDSLNSSQGDASNRSASRTHRLDGSRGRDTSVSNQSAQMDNAHRQWDKGSKTPQTVPHGVHVEDAQVDRRSRGDGSADNGKDLPEKIKRFKEKHQVGTDGKSKFSHRRSLSATTSSSEDSPGGRSLFRKRSSTFSIGDSKETSRRRTPTQQSAGPPASQSGRVRPFGILSVLKEMNETGSFSRPHSSSMSGLESQLPTTDKTSSELTYVTTSDILPHHSSQKPRSSSDSHALKTSSSSGSTTTTTNSISSATTTSKTPTSAPPTASSSLSLTSSSPSQQVTIHPSPRRTTPVSSFSASSTTTASSSSLSSSSSSFKTNPHNSSFSSASIASTISKSSSFSSDHTSGSSPSLDSSSVALLANGGGTPTSSKYAQNYVNDSPTKNPDEEPTKPLLVTEELPRKTGGSGGARKSLLKGN